MITFGSVLITGPTKRVSVGGVDGRDLEDPLVIAGPVSGRNFAETKPPGFDSQRSISHQKGPRGSPGLLTM